MSDEVRTRFAPSPTGWTCIWAACAPLLHTTICPPRSTAASCPFCASKILDQEREVPGAVDLIYKSTRQAGLTYDEGPDVGGERLRPVYPDPAPRPLPTGTRGSWSKRAARTAASAPRKKSRLTARPPKRRAKPTNTTKSACIMSAWKRPSAALRRASLMSSARTCRPRARRPSTTCSTATSRWIATRWMTTCSSRPTVCRPTTSPTSWTTT